MQPAPTRISEHVAGRLPPTLQCKHWQYCMHSIGHHRRRDMNHTAIASHDITSFDIINTCFVWELKQICGYTKGKKLQVAEAC